MHEYHKLKDRKRKKQGNGLILPKAQDQQCLIIVLALSESRYHSYNEHWDDGKIAGIELQADDWIYEITKVPYTVDTTVTKTE